MLLRLHIYFVILASIPVTLISAYEDISPNAWGIARSRQKAKEEEGACPSCPDLQCNYNSDDLAATYYKKLVNFLFRNSKRIADDFEEKYLINIHLQITEAQLKALGETQDVRDIDAIVSTVLENSRNGLLVEAKEVFLSWYDRMHYGYLRIINSQSLMLVLMITIFMCSCVIMRTVFKLNWIATLVINLACVSLFFKYLDCNRRLEFENIQRLKKISEEPNPCERTTKYFGLMSTYDGQKCTDYMMSIHGHDRQLCDPVDLTTDFFLSLTLKPFTKIMDNVGAFVDSSFNKHGYIKGPLVIATVVVAMTYWLRGFFGVVIASLWTSRSTGSTAMTTRPEASNNASNTTQPIVNVHIKLDPRAIGDYVQQVKLDEEKSRATLCITPGPESSFKGIENVADGFEEDLNATDGGKIASDSLPNAQEAAEESSMEEADIEKDVK